MQSIKVDGLERTKNDIVTKHVQPVLLAKNFEEVSDWFSVRNARNLYFANLFLPVDAHLRLSLFDN